MQSSVQSTVQSDNHVDDAYIAGFGSIKTSLVDLNERLYALELAVIDNSSTNSDESDTDTDTDGEFVVVGNEDVKPAQKVKIGISNTWIMEELEKTTKIIADLRTTIATTQIDVENKMGGSIDYLADKIWEVKSDLTDRVQSLRTSIDYGLDAAAEATRENLDAVSKRIDVVEAKADDGQSRITHLQSRLGEFAKMTHGLLTKLQNEILSVDNANKSTTQQLITVSQVLHDHMVAGGKVNDHKELIDHLTERYNEIKDELKAFNNNLSELFDQVAKMNTMAPTDDTSDILGAHNDAINKLRRESDTHLKVSHKATEHIVQLFESISQIRERVDMLVGENVLKRHNELNNVVIYLLADHEALTKQVEELMAKANTITKPQASDDADNTDADYIVDAHTIRYHVYSPAEPYMYRLHCGDKLIVPIKHNAIEKYATYYIQEVTFNVPAGQHNYSLVGSGIRAREWVGVMDSVVSSAITINTDNNDAPYIEYEHKK
nr:Hypothetical protein FSTVLC9_299 [Faustovirus]